MKQQLFLGLAGRTRAVLTCISLISAACSSGKPESDAEDTSRTSESDGGAGPSENVTIIVADETVSCKKDVECDDGDVCNGDESCVAGYCARGKSINCNDGIACTEDFCDPELGTCSNEPVDDDHDGHASADCLDKEDEPLGDDCDDADSERFPGNIEECTVTQSGDDTTPVGDGVDEDCDPTTVGERDDDEDGFVDAVCFNVTLDGSREIGPDCDSTNSSVHPGTSEVCDHFDNNCDGEVDEGLTITLFEDPDRDGFGGVVDPADPQGVLLIEKEVCPGEVGVTDSKTDCGPSDRMISPDRNELCDGVDNDCNGEIDENVVPSIWYRDFDRDGWGDLEGGVKSTCERIDHLGWSLFLGDCDDGNPLVNPGQEEVCDGLDNDCKTSTTFLISAGDGEDDDTDGTPDPDCGVLGQDCNDDDSTVYPGAPELCDDIDNDCNGVKDTSTKIVKWYVDQDGDGAGVESGAIESCEPVIKRVTEGGDCDDKNPLTHPFAADNCSGQHDVDDDCDGETDEGETPVYSYRDEDGDGYGNEAVISSCSPVTGEGYVASGNDCDETSSARNPGAAEECSADSTSDQDCDGYEGCQDSQCFGAAACQSLYGLQLVSPSTNPITTFVSQSFQVTVSLTDFEENPIPNAALTVEGEAGCLVPSTVSATDSNGRSTFELGVGMASGPYIFTVKSGATDALKFTVNAQYPQAGTVWSVVNRAGVNTSTVVENSFGPKGSSYYPRDIETTSDNGAYLAGYYDVFHIDPVGQLHRIAGTGGGSLSGDGGPALAAGLGSPRWIAFDAVRNLLYIANTSVVRAVKLSVNPPTIHHAIGGGSGPIPGIAELASIGTISGLELLSDGQVLVSTSLGLLRYNPEPTAKTLSYYGLTSDGYSDSFASFYSSYGPGIAQQGIRTLFYGYYLRGEEFGNSVSHGIGAYDGTSSYRLIGRPPSSPNLALGEGSHADNSYLSTDIDAAAMDAAGNLIFSAGQAVFWQIDAVTQRASRFAGQLGTAGLGDEYVSRLNAQFLAGALSTDVGPDGDLWIAEYAAGGRVRRIRKGATGSRSILDVSILNADGVEYWPGELIEPTVSEVRDGSDSLVSGSVVHQTPQAGWEPLLARNASDIDGISFNGGRANVVVGEYSLQSQLLDLDRNVVSADVLSYKVVRPAPGSLTSWLNAEQSTTVADAIDGQPAVSATGTSLSGITSSADGSVYFSTSNYNSAVFRISPAGIVSLVAGGNGAVDAGDGLPALDARLYYPSHLALDDEQGLLYVTTGSGGSQAIRVIDLNSGYIDGFAGQGALTGLDIPAIDKAPWYIHSLVFYDGFLFVSSNGSIDVIDTSLENPTISAWATDAPCSSALSIYSLSASSDQLAFGPDGTPYLHAYVCGTTVSGSYAYGVVELDEEGAPVELLTGDGNLIYAPPHDAGEADGVYSHGMTIDSSGNIYFTEYGRHWLRKLTPGGILSTVAGSPSLASGKDDFAAGLSAQMNYPEALAVMPDDSVIILDSSNRSIRRYWP